MFSDVHLIMAEIMAEFLVAEHLFAHFLNKRERYPLRLVLTSVGCIAAAYFFPLLDYSIVVTGSITFLSLFLISGVGIFLCYSENLWSIVFCCVTGYTIQHLASSLHELSGFVFPTVPYLFRQVITLVIPYAVCYFIFSRDIRHLKKISIDNKQLLLLSTVGLFVYVVFGLVTMTLSLDNPQPEYEMLLHFSRALACVLILCLEFGLLSNKSLEIELGVVSQMLQEREKQYEASRDNIDIINQKCHDLRHQIRFLRKGAAVVDSAALKEIEKAVDIYDAAVKTGNAALDVILTEKSLLCEKNGIVLTCMADGGAIDFMAPGDIYSLFGNALENAVEAASQISDPEKRSIGVSVRAKGMMISIHVENCLEGTLSFENGLPQTNKDDKNIHGFGMKSMQSIAEKYGGFLTASTKNGVFNLDIVIPKR